MGESESFQRKEQEKQEKQENGDEEKDRGNANVNFRGGTGDEHFTVDGTLIEAWASLKSFQRKEQEKQENGMKRRIVAMRM